jgi:hypothetical protein
VLTAAALAAATLAQACSGPPRAGPTPLPDPAQLAAAYNANIAPIDHLRTRGIATVRWTDDDGDRQWEQGDLNLQLSRPERLALRIHKLGETLVWLGADADRYWLFDLLRDERIVFVGAHEAITPRTLDALGLPLPPGDLLPLMAIAPIPADLARVEPGPRTEEGAAGDIWLFAPAAATTGFTDATWRYRFPPESDRPVAVALIDRTGEVVLRSELSDPQQVLVPDMGGYFPVIHAKALIERPGAGASLTLVLDNLRADPPRAAAFDLDRLIDSLRPDRIVDVDAEVSATADADEP